MTREAAIVQNATRRYFLERCSIGLAGMFLSTVESPGAEAGPNPLLPKKPDFPAKARAVIYLHMAGSPSQLELFDHKPELTRYDGKPCPDELLKGKRFAFI